MISKINELLKEAHKIAYDSDGDEAELKKSQFLTRAATKLSLDLTKKEPNNIIAWQLLYGNICQSGAWDDSWGDFDEKQLEIINELIRLNPEDDDSKYKGSFYEVDYGYDGGLYFFKFEALAQVYHINGKDENWPDSEFGKSAIEALKKACNLYPEEAEYMLDEAKSTGVVEWMI